MSRGLTLHQESWLKRNTNLSGSVSYGNFSFLTLWPQIILRMGWTLCILSPKHRPVGSVLRVILLPPPPVVFAQWITPSTLSLSRPSPASTGAS